MSGSQFAPLSERVLGMLLSPVAVLLLLTLLVLSTRLLPLSISPLPYNNDGMTEARIASDILASGHLSYPVDRSYTDSYSVIMPVFNVVLAFASGLVGTTPFEVSQVATAFISILTVTGIYFISMLICKSRTGALAAALFTALFGTFVFLTGSTWRESLGIALFVLMVFAYMNRRDKRYLMLELAVLAVLPFTHHLVTVVAYLTLAYLTCWSLLSSLIKGNTSKMQKIDVVVIVVPVVATYAYYSMSSLERLSYVDSLTELAVFAMLFACLFVVMAVVHARKSHARISLAPIPASTIMLFVLWNYHDPIFPYAQGFDPRVLVLGFVSSVIVGCAWYGFESILEARSEFRTIPIGLLLPVVTLLGFAMVSYDSLLGHKMIYRTFDFADVALAVGISITVAHFRDRIKLRSIVVFSLICVLLVSFPFGYYTDSLLGMRHDTQEYEVDVLTWIDATNRPEFLVRSDERISYDGAALFGFGKDPYLPSRMVNGVLSGSNYLNVFLEEWTTSGVNDYPRGRALVDSAYADYVLSTSNVLYVGGPASNNIVVYQYSGVAYSYIVSPG